MAKTELLAKPGIPDQFPTKRDTPEIYDPLAPIRVIPITSPTPEPAHPVTAPKEPVPTR